MESCKPIKRLRDKKKKITIELNNVTNTSDNTNTLVTWNTPCQMAVLSDVVIFFNSIVVLTPNGQFLDCATIAFSERYNSNGIIRRQLSKLYPNLPDTCHNAYNSQDVSGSCWTVAGEGVPRSGMHCNT